MTPNCIETQTPIPSSGLRVPWSHTSAISVEFKRSLPYKRPMVLHSSIYRPHIAASQSKFRLEQFAFAFKNKTSTCKSLRAADRWILSVFHVPLWQYRKAGPRGPSGMHQPSVALQVLRHTWAIPPAVPAVRSLTVFSDMMVDKDKLTARSFWTNSRVWSRENL